MLNFTPPSMAAAEKLGWKKLSDFESRYHRWGCKNRRNVKMVSPDGHFEAVYHPDGTLVTDQTNGGTFNVQFQPGGAPWENVPHFIYDMLPYWVWGNGPDDTTPWWGALAVHPAGVPLAPSPDPTPGWDGILF